MLGALLRKFRGGDAGPNMVPLYNAVVQAARQPHWYLQGGVADSVDGRFEMVSAVLSLVLARLEEAGEAGQLPSVRLTEVFVDDMDGQLREAGFGDVVVGKHVGKMMSALGGRLGAYRDGISGGDLDGAILRNLHRDADKGEAARRHCADRLLALSTTIAATSLEDLVLGKGVSE